MKLRRMLASDHVTLLPDGDVVVVRDGRWRSYRAVGVVSRRRLCGVLVKYAEAGLLHLFVCPDDSGPGFLTGSWAW